MKTQSADFPFYLWILCGCLIPFSKFYSEYADDVYFLVMNCLASICVGKLLSGICEGMAKHFESVDELALANEAKIISKALVFLPVTFVIVLAYLLMSLQSGLNGLLLVGDLTLVTKFPVIMMIGAVFPIILICRALKIIDKREKKND
ncbi:hypothetical protein PQO03_01985 [Lentisphaera profundi]|uniref:MotA/TolQ/ExbB proton channel domain-containing protein n=1 Tax=Lentisphaera profundi TaxID=1658616 RepID=A0ABY7VV17_9BACT|nr:hypothetical protein [Lentisphaera profundi]WDE96732.1 hypothetical protein PQO03_01985 [Lentisphaera profundi]